MVMRQYYQILFQKIFKLRGGAGSANVQLVSQKRCDWFGKQVFWKRIHAS